MRYLAYLILAALIAAAVLAAWRTPSGPEYLPPDWHHTAEHPH